MMNKVEDGRNTGIGFFRAKTEDQAYSSFFELSTICSKANRMYSIALTVVACRGK